MTKAELLNFLKNNYKFEDTWNVIATNPEYLELISGGDEQFKNTINEQASYYKNPEEFLTNKFTSLKTQSNFTRAFYHGLTSGMGRKQFYMMFEEVLPPLYTGLMGSFSTELEQGRDQTYTATGFFNPDEWGTGVRHTTYGGGNKMKNSVKDVGKDFDWVAMYKNDFPQSRDDKLYFNRAGNSISGIDIAVMEEVKGKKIYPTEPGDKGGTYIQPDGTSQFISKDSGSPIPSSSDPAVFLGSSTNKVDAVPDDINNPNTVSKPEPKASSNLTPDPDEPDPNSVGNALAGNEPDPEPEPEPEPAGTTATDPNAQQGTIGPPQAPLGGQPPKDWTPDQIAQHEATIAKLTDPNNITQGTPPEVKLKSSDLTGDPIKDLDNRYKDLWQNLSGNDAGSVEFELQKDDIKLMPDKLKDLYREQMQTNPNLTIAEGAGTINKPIEKEEITNRDIRREPINFDTQPVEPGPQISTGDNTIENPQEEFAPKWWQLGKNIKDFFAGGDPEKMSNQFVSGENEDPNAGMGWGARLGQWGSSPEGQRWMSDLANVFAGEGTWQNKLANFNIQNAKAASQRNIDNATVVNNQNNQNNNNNNNQNQNTNQDTNNTGGSIDQSGNVDQSGANLGTPPINQNQASGNQPAGGDLGQVIGNLLAGGEGEGMGDVGDLISMVSSMAGSAGVGGGGKGANMQMISGAAPTYDVDEDDIYGLSSSSLANLG